MSSYEELREKYKLLSEGICKAIKEDKPWEELVEELFSCLSEMDETPEMKVQWKCLEEEADQLLKQLEEQGL